MPKHRSTCYTVVRERYVYVGGDEAFGDQVYTWVFDALVGTYVTITRAEEVAAATIQHYIDAGMDESSPEYRCSVKPSTFYEE
jgi:hypothetical protein